MEWFYAKDGKRIGPLSESSLEQRLGSGEIDLDTLVWCRGMEDWAPLRTVRLQADGGRLVFNAPPASSGHVCSECGRRFPMDDLVRIGGRLSCGDCKPAVLQKLQEGLLGADVDEACRDGRWVVLGRNGVLPPRCVKCNRPALPKPRSYRVFWAPPACGLIVLGGVVLAVLVGVFLGSTLAWLSPLIFFSSALIAGTFSSVRGQRVHVGVGICALHARKRFVFGGISGAAAIGGAVLLFLSGGVGWLMMVAIVAILAGVVGGMVLGNLVAAKKADKTHVWLKGAGQSFLESLPKWNGK